MRLVLLVSALLLGVSDAVAQRTPTANRRVDGKVLWLRADRGVQPGFSRLVGAWRDFSRSDNHLVQPDGERRPKFDPIGINGRPALRFDGNDFLARPNGMPTKAYTKVVVAVLDDTTDFNNLLSGATDHALFYGGNEFAKLLHTGSSIESSQPTTPGVPTILIATYDERNGMGHLYQDGVLVGSGALNAQSDSTLQLGGFGSVGSLVGAVAEVQVYDRVLGALDLATVVASLSAEYQSGALPDVTFTSLPKDVQLFPRNAQDQATVTIEGSIHTAGYDDLVVEVDRDGVLWNTTSQFLSYNGSDAPFSIDITIDAGLYEHDFRVYVTQGAQRTQIADRVHVTCGDVLLIQGQSNAQANDQHEEGLANDSASEWIRSFGSSTTGAEIDQDLHWDIADGLLNAAHAAVGAWALRMAEILVADYQVPIALINGAVGGTSIDLHQRNDGDPLDLDTIYGRLLYRAQESGTQDAARAILWYQGESDFENTTEYETGFADLHSDWHADYSSLEKIYVFQIRKGCGVDEAGVREVQRQLGDIHGDVVLAATAGIPTHDGCHFFYQGYRTLGEQVARLVARDLYGSLDVVDIEPPNILSADYVNTDRDRIVLSFRNLSDTLVWQDGAEAYFILEDGVGVLWGLVLGSTILLQLEAQSTATTITYDGHALDGPWILNGRGVGALTFFDVPIDGP